MSWRRDETRRLTFVLGRVIDAKISIPDDGQLYGEAAHLHPLIRVLKQTWKDRGRESESKRKRESDRGRRRER